MYISAVNADFIYTRQAFTTPSTMQDLITRVHHHRPLIGVPLSLDYTLTKLNLLAIC